MTLQIENTVFTPEQVTHNAGHIGFSRFDADDLDVREYRLAVPREALLEALSTRYAEVCEEMRADDAAHGGGSGFEALGYAPLAEAFAQPAALAGVLGYFLDEILERFVGRSQRFVWVINSVDAIEVTPEQVELRGRCFRFLFDAMTPADPWTREEIERALRSVEIGVARFFGVLAADELWEREGERWTAAEHLDHLNASVAAVARGFAIHPLLLRLRFGRAPHPSRRYAEVRDDYRARLAAGGRATRDYEPRLGEVPPADRAARREELLLRWSRVNERLRDALSRWSERDLDRVALPHPLLGRITAREMLLFTLYHGRHHLDGVKARVERFGA